MLEFHLLKLFGNFSGRTKYMPLDTLAAKSTHGDCGHGCVCFPRPLPLMSAPNCEVSSVHDNLLFIEKACIFTIR